MLTTYAWILVAAALFPAAALADAPPVPSTLQTVPLTQLSDGKFAVDVTIDGKGPFSLLVDTGSEVMVITPKVAQEAGLTVSTGNIEVQGPTGGFVPVEQTTVDTAVVAGITMTKPVCTVEDIDLPCDGLIGAPLFNAGVVRLDFADRTLTTYTGASFAPGSDDATLPITFGKERVPVVDAAIGGIDAHLEIDTGSAFPTEMNGDFVDAHMLKDMFLKIGSVEHSSVSGVASSDVYDIQSLALGDDSAHKLRGRIPSLFLDRKPGTPKRDFDGRVGCPLLAGAILTFDYPHSTLYFDAHPSTVAAQ